MRMFLKLLISFLAAGAICAVLVMTGVLQLGSGPHTGQTPAVKGDDQKALTRKDASTTDGHGDTHAPGAEKTKAPEKKPEDMVREAFDEGPENEAGAGGDRTVSSQASAPESPFLTVSREVYERSLSYLRFLARDRAGNPEERFSRFLKTEFDLSGKEIDQVLQMSFWKNFLVLQKDWPAGESAAERLEKAFERELSLKEAGFAAMGIRLMPAEVAPAKNRLAKMEQRMTEGSGNSHLSGEVK